MHKSLHRRYITSLLNLARFSFSKSKQCSTLAIKPCTSQNVKQCVWQSCRIQFSMSTQSPFPVSNPLVDEKDNLEHPKEEGCLSSESDKATAEIEGSIENSTDEDDVLDVQFITNGDPVLEKKLKVLFLEVDVLRQEGRKVPLAIKNEQWKELVNTISRSSRRKYLSFLWGIEIKKGNKKRKKDEERVTKIYDTPSEYDDNGHIRYGLNHNTIYMRIYDTTINQLYNNKLVQAMQFGQKIVVDCGYDSHMTNREAQNAAKQIMFLFAENRIHNDPFNLYLCNANREGNTVNQLKRFINTMYDDHFPLNVTEKSYLDLFPKENIVYLTPHCREELTEFDHDAVYVIGGIVDKVNQEPLSLAKAKKEGIRMAKLPLERYLNWGSGSGKSLTLNQMMLIMLEMKTSGDWKKALEHVPRRKINEDNEPGTQYRARHRQEFQRKRNKY